MPCRRKMILRIFLFRILKAFRGTLLALLFMSMVIVAPAPAIATSPEVQEPEYGGTLHLGWHGKPAPLNPFNTTDTISGPVLHLIFNRLVRLDQKGEFEPDLARGWNISDDGLVYTFYLRENVKFHDGTPLTSKDVLNTFRLFTDSQVSLTFHKEFEVISGFRIPSDFVFQIILKEPFAPFLLTVWRVHITPAHLLKNKQDDLKSFIEHPIGTGPFVYSRREPDRILLSANQNYFESRPYLDHLEIKIFGSKAYVWSTFLRGGLDMLFYLDREDFQQIKNNPSLKLYRSFPIAGYRLAFNHRNPLLGDPKIRRAISLAINREEIMNALEEGEGILIDGSFHPESWAFNKQIKRIAYDPEQAKAILQEKGFIFRDGLLEREGMRFVLSLIVDERSAHLQRIAKMIRQELQEIGVITKFEIFKNQKDLNLFLETTGLYCYLFLFNTGLDPDHVKLYFSSRERFNYGHYSNLAVDDLFQRGRTFQDRGERKKIYDEIQTIFEKEMPAFSLYIPSVFHASSMRVANAEFLLGPFIPFHFFKEVFLVNEREGGD